MQNREDIAYELMNMSAFLSAEDEGIDLSDIDMTLEEIVGLRSLMSSWRRGIDGVSKALAQKWDDEHGNATYETEHTDWFLSRPKGKRAYDQDALFAWLATKDADELKRLVPVRSIKVGGMTPAERTTLLDEQSTRADLVITNKPKR